MLDQKAHQLDHVGREPHALEDRARKDRAFDRVVAALDLPDVVQERRQVENALLGELDVEALQRIIRRGVCAAERYQVLEYLEAVLVDGIVVVEVVALETGELVVLRNDAHEESRLVERAHDQGHVAIVFQQRWKRAPHALRHVGAVQFGLEHVLEPAAQRPVELLPARLLLLEHRQRVRAQRGDAQRHIQGGAIALQAPLAHDHAHVAAMVERGEAIGGDSVDGARVAVVFAHEELDRQVLAARGEPERFGDVLLRRHGQRVLLGLHVQVELDAGAQQEVVRRVQLGALTAQEQPLLAQRREPLGRSAHGPQPHESLVVAQPARAHLHAGLDQLKAVTGFLVACERVFDLAAEEFVAVAAADLGDFLLQRARHPARTAYPAALDQSRLGVHVAGERGVGFDHGFHRVPELEPAVPHQAEERARERFHQRRLLSARHQDVHIGEGGQLGAAVPAQRDHRDVGRVRADLAFFRGVLEQESDQGVDHACVARDELAPAGLRRPHLEQGPGEQPEVRTHLGDELLAGARRGRRNGRRKRVGRPGASAGAGAGFRGAGGHTVSLMEMGGSGKRCHGGVPRYRVNVAVANGTISIAAVSTRGHGPAFTTANSCASVPASRAM